MTYLMGIIHDRSLGHDSPLNLKIPSSSPLPKIRLLVTWSEEVSWRIRASQAGAKQQAGLYACTAQYGGEIERVR